MAWWIWMVGGFVLVSLELLFGGELWLLLAGLSAVVVGLFAGAEILPPAGQYLAFAALVGSAFLLRRRFLPPNRRSRTEAESASLLGELGTATSTILPGKPGDAQFRGARWPARSATGRPIEAGSGIRVARTEGITLFVEPEPPDTGRTP